jgi:hypothetical protein
MTCAVLARKFGDDIRGKERDVALFTAGGRESLEVGIWVQQDGHMTRPEGDYKIEAFCTPQQIGL